MASTSSGEHFERLAMVSCLTFPSSRYDLRKRWRSYFLPLTVVVEESTYIVATIVHV